MLPTTPVAAARFLNIEHLPKAYEGRTTTPPLHEPKLMYIADLFLSNRHPHDLCRLARNDPKRAIWLDQWGAVTSSQNYSGMLSRSVSISLDLLRVSRWNICGWSITTQLLLLHQRALATIFTFHVFSTDLRLLALPIENLTSSTSLTLHHGAFHRFRRFAVYTKPAPGHSGSSWQSHSIIAPKAVDAGLPWDLTDCIGSRDSIDTAKYMFNMQIWERIGSFPKLSSFQLEKYDTHICVSPTLSPASKLWHRDISFAPSNNLREFYLYALLQYDGFAFQRGTNHYYAMQQRYK